MKTVLFLHGWGASSESFAPVRQFFSDNYDCIFIDFDCDPKTVATLDNYVEFVEEALVRESVTHCHIVGHSFGARVAVLLALQNPYMIKKLVLTGAAGLRPRFKLSTWARIKMYKAFGIGKGSPDYKKLSLTGKATFKNVIRRDLSYEVQNVKNETLLIFGTKDRATPPYMARRWKRLQKSATLKMYDGAGHYAFIDDPGRFLMDAHRFLGGSNDCD